MAENNPLFGNKLSNVIGVPVPQWLINQFRVRSEQNTVISNRSNENLKYLANKNAWVRLVSSVNITGEDLQHFKKYVGDSAFVSSNPIALAVQSIKDASSLAKNFVLFAGTSKYSKDQNRNFGYDLRSGLGESYGMLGEDEVNRYGYQPMPGITSVTIETMGRMGSVRSAVINFKVFDKMQLDIVDALYFKLGYTMFLEWANTYYYETPNSVELPNSTELVLKSSEDLSIDPFEPGLTKEKLNCKINKKVAESYGNYDAMLGMVTNFNFARKEDGSYDCSVKLIGLGVLAESIKINTAKDFSKYLEDEIKFLVQRENIKRQQEREKAIEDEKKQLENLKEQEKQVKKETQEALTLEEILISELEVQDLSSYKYQSSGFSGLNEDYVFDQVWAIKKITNFSETGDRSVSGPYIISNINSRKGVLVKNVIRSVKLSGRIKTILENEGKEKIINDINNIHTASSNSSTTIDIFYKSVYDTKYKIKLVFPIYAFDSTSLRQLLVKYDIDINYAKEISSIVMRKTLDILLDRNIQIVGNGDKSFSVETKPFLDRSNVYYNPEGYRPVISFDFKILSNNEILEETKNQINTIISRDFSRRDINKIVYEKKLKDALDEIMLGFTIGFSISDSDLISEIVLNNNIAEESRETLKRLEESQLKQIELSQIEIQEQIKAEESALPPLDFEEVQTAEVQKYSSSLETALRIIQIHSLNKAGVENKKVIQVDLTKENDKGDSVKKRLFSDHGLFSTVYPDIFDNPNNIPDLELKTLDKAGEVELFRFFAKYGFNNAILSGTNNNDEDLKKMVFDQKELLKSYVIPIQVSQDFSNGIVLERPVHIKLGTLLLLLNHLSLIYDKKDENDKYPRPLVYLDYNPNTNLCLTAPNHLSTNPIEFLIPFNGKKEDFETIFDPSVLKELKNRGEAVFDPETDDKKSADIPQFLDTKSIYRGRVMDILIDIQYILNTIKRFVASNETNSVYLKSFLEAILSDISKYTGNYNIYRLAYNDQGNCLYIVDDQLLPSDDMVYRSTPVEKTEIPLYGKKSIAKNLEIRTDISTRLSNMIAISANSSNKSGLSTDASSFGFINNNFTDRYVTFRGDVEGIKKENAGAETNPKIPEGSLEAANIFNASIKSFYAAGDEKSINVSADAIPTATNYYISKMAKVKSENSSSRASAIIPVSINFTTDGVSAFNMYQTFTVDDELLPYTYSSTRKQEESRTPLKKVGFCVIGLTHTIENNQWNTSVKSNMVFLKDESDFFGQPRNINRTKKANAETIVTSTQSQITPSSWQQIAFEFIAREESFLEIPRIDAGTLRGGYGTDRILINGVLQRVTSSTRFTRDTARDTLIREIETTYSRRVIRRIGESKWNILNNRQKAALTSYAYNVGFGERSEFSNKIVSAINSNSSSEVVAKLISEGPVTSDGIVLQGLVERRKKEANLYIS